MWRLPMPGQRETLEIYGWPTPKEKPMTKTYDPRCYDLAEIFLSNEPATSEREKRTKDLAQHIQNAIEDWSPILGGPATAIVKERERLMIESGPEFRERERVGLRKPVNLSLSDEWCLEAAEREAKRSPQEKADE